MYSNLNDLTSNYFSLANNNNTNRLHASIGNSATGNNSTSYDLRQNSVFLDIKNNSEQIFINGIKLGSILPKISEASKKVSDSLNSINTLEATSIVNPTSVSLIVEPINTEATSTALVRVKSKKVFHFRSRDKQSDLNGMMNWIENPNELASNLIIINNKQQVVEGSKETAIINNNKLPKLEQNANATSHSLSLLKPNSFSSINNNSSNYSTAMNVNNNYTFQSNLKPISFKLPAPSANTASSESFFENTNRMSKLINFDFYAEKYSFLKSIKDQEKSKPNIIIENKGITYEESNPISIMKPLENKYYEPHLTHTQNMTINKIGKSSSLAHKEEEPKDKRFRKKLIPITDAVKQPKLKKISIEFTKPKAIIEEINTSHFNESSTNSFQILQNDSFLSFQSSNNVISVPLPVSQITIRSMPKVDTTKPLVKPRTPRGSVTELRPPNHGRWSPIKITPMKSQKIFEKLKIEDYDTEKLRELTNKFKELDSDDDGHLEYQLIDDNYCQSLKPSQKSFIYQLYQILSEPNYFGLKEFFSLVLILEQIQKLNTSKLENYWEHFNQTDFESYKDDIKEFIKLIDLHDLKGTLRIGDVIKAKNRNFDSDRFFKNSRYQIQNILTQLRFQIEGDDLPSKMSSYILLIPLYIHLECLIRNKTLIKRPNLTNRDQNSKSKK